MNEIPCSHFWLISHATALIWLGLYGAQQSLRIRPWDQGSYSQVPVWTEVVCVLDWGTDDQLQECCHLMAQMSFPLGLLSVEENSLIQSHDPFPQITHIQRWMQGTKPGPPTFIQNNLKGSLQLQGLPWDWLTSVFIPPQVFVPRVTQCTYISTCESAFQRTWSTTDALGDLVTIQTNHGIKIVSQRPYRSEGSWSATETR